MKVIESDEQISDIMDRHKIVVIWGTGVYGRKFQKKIFSFERKEDIFFCDNNAKTEKGGYFRSSLRPMN